MLLVSLGGNLSCIHNIQNDQRTAQTSAMSEMCVQRLVGCVWYDASMESEPDIAYTCTQAVLAKHSHAQYMSSCESWLTA